MYIHIYVKTPGSEGKRWWCWHIQAVSGLVSAWAESHPDEYS